MEASTAGSSLDKGWILFEMAFVYLPALEPLPVAAIVEKAPPCRVLQAQVIRVMVLERLLFFGPTSRPAAHPVHLVALMQTGIPVYWIYHCRLSQRAEEIDMLAKPYLAQASLFGLWVLLVSHARLSYVAVFAGGRQGRVVELVSLMRRGEGGTQRTAQTQVQVTSILVY